MHYYIVKYVNRLTKNKKGYNIYKNAIRYFSYPSSIKPLVEMEDKVRFPKGIFHLRQHLNSNSFKY